MRGSVQLLVASVAIAANGANVLGADLPISSLKLPPGFSITVHAEVPGARSMALGAKGTLFVGTREKSGAVWALPDGDRDGKPDNAVKIADDLEMPNGVAFRDGALYVAAVSRVLRFDDVEAKLAEPPKPVVVRSDYPTDRHHGWKYIAFGPDGWLYVPVGAPCNVCLKEDARYASITRMKPDGSSVEVFARGIRNTVGFDWNPATRELWFTDNGRDWLGDEGPPDELNRAPKPGLHFGFPHCHGTQTVDDEFAKGHRCSEFVAPERELGPHVAALGMKFYRGTMFPPEYRGQIFLAEHGSWNRSKKIGYRVALVKLKDGKVVSYEPFLEGFLSGESAWGRPVDVLELPDGSLLVSDDKAGAIYRITYRAPSL